MRVVNGVFCVLLILFAAVQYNDSDGLFWGLLYLAGSVATGLAAFRPAVYMAKVLLGLCLAATAAVLVGVIIYWPKTPGFWRSSVWWETETAREGMGMMILFIAFLCAAFVAWRRRNDAAY